MNKLLPLIALLLTAALAAGCGSDDGTADAGDTGGTVRLVAYSTPQEAYADLIKAFNATEAGKNVKVETSFGASGDQSRAVAAGLPADVVALSLAPDVDKLVEPGIVAEDWTSGPNDGFVTSSVVVFLVRKGNPKNLKTWEDLTKPGVEVVTPNPATSGGAKWNVMAAVGANDDAYLTKLVENVVAFDKSARDALQTFAAGKGDVLLAYENEAFAAKQKGLEVEQVTPEETILIQNPIAVTQDGKKNPKTQAFVDFVLSAEGQEIFADHGYRGGGEQAAGGVFDITKFGGWSEVNKTYFDEKTGVFAKVQAAVGSGG
jgi:sulfate/thiosulfate transport system substrate-binding protein